MTEARVITPAEFLAVLDGIDELASELITGLLQTIPDSILATFESDAAARALPAEALQNLKTRVRTAELSFRLADRSTLCSNASPEVRLELLARDMNDARIAVEEAEARSATLSREYMELRFPANGADR